ncbi:MtnX-like HAD-IB family phosphatase [Alicyclobacillus contaminans]|uniref:MtnX-like HAD-IB family phosphatase n=1 Tax=Alicyclobacillus contaminans TaxID=392016 RepID=UPI0004064DFB|nr:MtnX-like HAD-IB family phosphatase [Alicyclobacillus contaminans]
MTGNRLAFYCDFDGTIAERDMIGVLVRRFAPPEALDIVQDVNAKRRTVKDGVEAMFRMTAASVYPQMVEYVREHTVLRPGFAEFVERCRTAGWRLTVVSGGFDFFVVPALAPFADTVAVYCNRLVEENGHLQVVWRVPCDETCEGGCGLCKPAVIRRTRRPGERLVVVGDGVTDVKQAQLADFVFARDKLLAECQRLHLPHASFDTFYDILEHPWVSETEVR